MSWLKHNFSFSIYFLFGLSLFGCNRGYDDVNKSIQPSQSSVGTFVKIDSTNIKTSTVLYDFVLSNNSIRALIGEYNNPIFGKLKSESYFQFSLQSIIPGPNIKYDSVAIYFNVQEDGLAQYSYGNPDEIQNFKIHRLTEDIYLPYGNIKALYNNQTYTFDNNILAEFSISQKELAIIGKTKNIRVALKSDFGKEIIDNYRTYLKSDNDLTKSVKGIYIKSENNTAVWGILGGYLRLYYHDFYGNNNIKTPYNVDIPIGQKVRNLQVDRQNTALANLSSTTPIETQTCFVQASTGVGTRVQFPFLENFEKDLKATKVVINKAELVIRPDLSSSNGETYGPPSQIFPYLLDQFGNVKKSNPVTIKDNNGVELRTIQNPFTLNDQAQDQQVQNDALSKVNFNNGEYKINLTTYLQGMIDGKRDFKESILIAAETQSIINENNTFKPPLAEINSFVFYNKPNTPYNIKLKIIYSTF